MVSNSTAALFVVLCFSIQENSREGDDSATEERVSEKTQLLSSGSDVDDER